LRIPSRVISNNFLAMSSVIRFLSSACILASAAICARIVLTLSAIAFVGFHDAPWPKQG
jgi:hypothetical protein